MDKAIQILQDGGIIAIPTETVYGLAVDATNIDAVHKLFTIKWRPENKAISIQLWYKENIGKYAWIDHPREQKIIDSYMPWSITLVLRKKEIISDTVTAGSPFVGVRIPQHPDTLALLQYIDFPLAVPSANMSGEKPAQTLQETEQIFADSIQYYMSNKYPMSTIASTVVQIVDGKIVILREGAITFKQIQSACQ